VTNALSLATRAARGVLWTGGAAVLQLVSLLVLYRLLPIASMGRFEFILILVMFLALLASLGLCAALVQRRDAGDLHFDAAFWVSLAVGTAMAAALIVAARPIGVLLGGEAAPEFADALRILAFILPCAAVSGIFRARLQRELNFGAIARAELVSVLAFGVYVVPLVYLWPAWGVAIPLTGSVLREFGLLVGLWHEARWTPRWRFSAGAIRQMLPFGLNFTGSRAVAYLNSNIASLYIFPLLGETAQGYYRLAERLTINPLTRLSTTITHVSLPTFATVQDDDERLARGYLRSVQSLVLFLGPLLAGMMVFSPEILAVLGQEPALAVLRLLAAATLLRAMGTMVGSVFMAKGRANWLFRWSLFCLVVLVPALSLGVGHGITAVAAIVAASSLLFLMLSQHFVNRLLGLSMGEYLGSMARPAAVIAAVAVTGAFARPRLPGSPVAVLVQGVVLCSLAGGIALRGCAWALLREFYQSLRGRRTRGAEGFPPAEPGA